MSRIGYSALALLLMLGSAGCDKAQELRAKQSAGGVLLALKVLRDAPNAQKEKALVGLAQAPCNGQDVCEVRDACREAYALHVSGVALTNAAKQQLVEGKALDASKLLGSAEANLKSAAGKVEACNDRAAALQRRYDL